MITAARQPKEYMPQIAAGISAIITSSIMLLVVSRQRMWGDGETLRSFGRLKEPSNFARPVCTVSLCSFIPFCHFPLETARLLSVSIADFALATVCATGTPPGHTYVHSPHSMQLTAPSAAQRSVRPFADASTIFSGMSFMGQAFTQRPQRMQAGASFDSRSK